MTYQARRALEYGERLPDDEGVCVRRQDEIPLLGSRLGLSANHELPDFVPAAALPGRSAQAGHLVVKDRHKPGYLKAAYLILPKSSYPDPPAPSFPSIENNFGPDDQFPYTPRH